MKNATQDGKHSLGDSKPLSHIQYVLGEIVDNLIRGLIDGLSEDY